MKVHMLFTGLGAGNIGDEVMFAGFLNAIYPPLPMTVDVYDRDAPIVKTLPQEFIYLNYYEEEACLKAALDSDIVLLVGGTPVMEDWGLDWPMCFHAKQVTELNRHGRDIFSVGVGVDRLVTNEGRRIFSDNHLNIKSWTVRSNNCRGALIDLGVSDDRIRVGADFAWLFEPDMCERVWAEDYLIKSGIDVTRQILGINVVNEKWADDIKMKKEIAFALDRVSQNTGIQVAFLCNETREGAYFDLEASKQVASFMNSKSIILGNSYFTPSQMSALLSFLTIAVSQRYHFTILNVLAKTPVLSFSRGQKLLSLLQEFGETPLGSMENLDGENLYANIMNGLKEKEEIKKRQQTARILLGIRAYKNTFFLSNKKDYMKPLCPQLARVSEIEKPQFKVFMNRINDLAELFGLRQFTNWSKVWEYPWLWFNGLCRIDWSKTTVLDLGSELSPMPWFLASLGAKVTLLETDANSIHIWEKIKRETGLSVEWKIIDDEHLPFPDESFDVVTSFSVIEHQTDKNMAINEIARVLKPGGMFALSFDICEPEMGMTFPEWNGRALTTREFEEVIWNHPAFEEKGISLKWNFEDCKEFVNWHLQSAPHHNYTVGSAVLHKTGFAERKATKINQITKPVFLHIPKAAGTTFLQMLVNAFGQEHVYWLNHLEYDDSFKILQDIEQTDPERIYVIVGHINYGIHNILSNNYTYFTVVRDPVQRALSFFDYAYSSPEHPLYETLRKGPIDFSDPEILNNISNLQTRMLCNSTISDISILSSVSKEYLKIAKRRLQSCAAVGITEEFDAFISLVNAKFGWNLSKIQEQNVTPHRKYRAELDQAMIERIREHNRLDIELYEYAKELFTKQLREISK